MKLSEPEVWQKNGADMEPVAGCDVVNVMKSFEPKQVFGKIGSGYRANLLSRGFAKQGLQSCIASPGWPSCTQNDCGMQTSQAQERHAILIKGCTMSFSGSDAVFIPIDMELLSAYVDGELDYKTEAEVESCLLESPQAQAIVDQYRRLDKLLHQSFDPLPAKTSRWRANGRQAKRRHA